MTVKSKEGVLEDTFSSPWSWSRSSSPWPSQVLKNVLSSARGQHYFLIGFKEKPKQKTTYLIVCQFVISFPYLKNNAMWIAFGDSRGSRPKKLRETKLRLQLNNFTQKLDFDVLWFKGRA